jgi:hypothetical protein
MRASNLTIEPFRPAHFGRLDLQAAQAYVREYVTAGYLAGLAAGGPAYTILDGERAMFCGGLKEFSTERGMLWSYIARDAGVHFTRLHRYVKRFIGTVERAEITATCQTGFAVGARWLQMLDFRFVRPLGPFGLARVPHDLYLRVP